VATESWNANRNSQPHRTYASSRGHQCLYGASSARKKAVDSLDLTYDMNGIYIRSVQDVSIEDRKATHSGVTQSFVHYHLHLLSIRSSAFAVFPSNTWRYPQHSR
jgi:hypothetical protein